MPGRDGSGPMGAGPRSGRGLGICNGYNENWGGRRGCGLGRGAGFGRGVGCGRGAGYGAGYGTTRGAQVAGRTLDEVNLKEYQIYLEEELKRVKLDLEGNK